MNCPRSISSFLLMAAGFLSACGLSGDTAHSEEPPVTSADSGSAKTPTTKPHKQHPANHLAQETSPYLLLHVHNPVDWHPWGPEAFAKAKAENKPIFLSIGYSSCFWCHVMERESFTDEEIAAYLNEHFVSIKVDREERPDIDDIYMTALQVYFQAVGSPQGGGWPMSLFLTPDGKPMMGGTYFPPKSIAGRPGFLSVIHQVHTIWTEKHDQITVHADQLAREVRRIMQPVAQTNSVPLDRSLVSATVAALRKEYDAEYGGVDFNAARPVGPKFPVPSRLMLLQSQVQRDSADATSATTTAASHSARDMLDNTLEHMRRGGIYDHLGGGFHRYSTDRRWLVPHFEKMLYDNAQLAEVYAQAYRRTNLSTYRDAAEETYAFVLRELTDPGGAFYSALDAETDGIEGQFYVWSPDEVTRVLGKDDAALFSKVYGMQQPEFFEHGYVMHLPQPIEKRADELSLPIGELRDRLDVLKTKLLAVRNERPELLRDDKILTSWNGLMIRSLAIGGDALARPDLIEAAERAALFLLVELRNDEGRLLRTHRASQSKLNAYLDDYAFLTDGLLALHKVTGNEEWLSAAQRLTDGQLEQFWDDAGHGFYFTSDDHEELLARTKNAYDSVIPSGNAVSVRNLTRLAQQTGNVVYRDRAKQTLQAFAPKLSENPASMTFMALALDEYLTAFGDGDVEVTAAKPPVDTERQLAQGAPVASAQIEQPLIVAGRTNPRDRDAKVSAKVYLSVDKLPPGGETDIVVVLNVLPHWHINSNPPSKDFLVQTELTAESQLNTTLTKVAYPQGHPFTMKGSDEPISVYEGQVILRAKLKAPASAAGQTDKIEMTIAYQSCNDKTCLRPTTARMTVQVPIATRGETSKSINQRLFAKKTSAGR